MKRWENLLLVIDKPTNRIVFRTPWSDWPQMIPTSHQLAVRNYKGWVDFSDTQWNDFQVAWPRLMYGLETYDPQTHPLDRETNSRLLVEREKSALAWRWLNVLYAFDRSVTGMIPGIDLVDSDAELKLLEQERAVVKSMIAQDLKKHWKRIWEATSNEELVAIANEIKFESRNSQAFM
jgi:hypothetical protein